MAGLMVGDPLFLVGVHDSALAFQTDRAALDGLVEVDHGDMFPTDPCRQQGRLVDQIGQVRPRHARRQAGHAPQIDVRPEADVAHMDLEDSLSPEDVRTIYHHRPIEASRTQQCRIESLRPIGRGHQDHATVGVKAIHLDEELVERLFAFVVPADHRAGSRLAQRIEFVHEDDARGLRRRRGEEVTHPAAPTPTNISTKSDPERLKNGTSASPATARASSVFPVPGGPTSSTPLGMRPPSAWYFSGR